jgi:cell shape-determining protein MreC
MTSHRKKYIWILILCVLVLATLIFFEPSYGWRLRATLTPRDIISADDPTLPAQNQVLQAQVAQLQTIAAQEATRIAANTIPAMVYSQYPFGFKNELLVNVGANEGVATGSAATYQGVFVGTVAHVFAESAVIQTVFDPSFKMAVRVGNDGVDALLQGGAYPDATSIAKGSAIASGNIIYTAAPGIPYGLPVAVVAATSTSPDNLFENASLNFAYDINNIQAIVIQK